MNNTHNLGIFRSVKKEDTTTRLHKCRKTMRHPRNVPYVVDNLWEWKRPKKYYNRRFSVFASPQEKLAMESGPSGETVYRVEFKRKYNLCQLKKYKDSKYHPDCRLLKKILLGRLGQDWLNGKLSDKEEIGRL